MAADPVKVTSNLTISFLIAEAISNSQILVSPPAFTHSTKTLTTSNSSKVPQTSLATATPSPLTKSTLLLATDLKSTRGGSPVGLWPIQQLGLQITSLLKSLVARVILSLAIGGPLVQSCSNVWWAGLLSVLKILMIRTARSSTGQTRSTSPKTFR